MTHPYATAVVEVELDWNNLDAKFEAGVKASTERASKVLQQHFDRVSAASASSGIDNAARKLQANVAGIAKQANRSATEVDKAHERATRSAEKLADATGKVRLEQLAYDKLVKAGKAETDAAIKQKERLGKAIRDEAAATRANAAAKKAEAAATRPAGVATDAFQRNLLDRVSKVAQHAEIALPVTVDGEQLRRRMRADVASVAQNVSAQIPVEPKLAAEARAAAVAEVERLERELGKPVHKDVKIHPDLSAWTSLTSSIASIGGTATKIAGVATLVAAIGGAAGVAAGAVSALGFGLLALGSTAAIGVGTAVLGLHGIMSTLKAYSAADDSAQEDAKDKAKAVAAATKQVEQAEKSVRDAKRESRWAEKDLTQARIDALTNLRDLNRELAGSALNEKDAQLALLEAQRDLAKLPITNPTADAIDRARAVLRVQQAEQRLKEVRDKNQDLDRKTIDANRKGVEDADDVVKAKERVAQANEKVTDSQKAVTQAQKELHDAQTKQSSAAQKAAQEFAKLSPNAQAVVTAMRTLKPALEDVRKSTSDKLLAGWDADLTQLAGAILPTVKDGLGQVATALNGAGHGFAQFWSSADARRGLADVFAGTRDVINSMQPGLAGITQGVLDFASAARPAMSQVGAAAGGVLAKIGNALTQALQSGEGTKLFQSFATVLDGLGSGLQPLIGGLIQVGNIVGPVLGPFLAQLGKSLADILPSLGQLGVSLLQALQPVLPALASFISALSSGLQPILPVAGQLLIALGEALKPLIKPFSDMTVLLGQYLIQALQSLAPQLPGLADALLKLLVALEPMLPPMLRLATDVIPAVVFAMKLLAPVIREAGEITAWLVDVLVGSFMPTLRGLERLFSDTFRRAGEIVSGAKDILREGIAGISGLFDGLAHSVGGVWDGIIRVIAVSVRTIGDLLKHVPTVHIPGTSITIGGGVAAMGQSLVEWAAAHGAAHGGVATAAGVARYVGGGRAIHGPGTGTSDSILAMLNGRDPLAISNGEFISTAAAYRNGAPLLWALNHGWVPSPEVLHALVPGFASGGVPGKSFAESMAGVQYAMGGFSRSAIDCSGMVSATINAALGRDPFSSRTSTPEEGQWLANLGAVPGLGAAGDINVGWYDNGGGPNGHTALTLGDGTNVESNGEDGVIIGGPTGATSSIFDQQAHIPRRLLLGGDLGTDGGGTSDIVGSRGPAGGLSGGGKGSYGRSRSGGASGLGGGSNSGTGQAIPVQVVNWPGGIDLGATASAAGGAAAPSSALAPPLSAGVPGAQAQGIPGVTAPNATGIEAANAWAAQQNFPGQFENWGFGAIKSIVGEFADVFGLKKLSDMGLDQARTALTPQIKVADTVNFYGVNDPNRIADANARMLRDRMTPVSETYRGG